jgi:hypothetical protein
MTHREILSSLEVRRSPRKIQGDDYAVEVVEVHASDPGTAKAIDAEENGDAR